MRKPTANVTDQRSGERDDPFGDATGVHQLARNDEEGNGQQREGIHADKGACHDAVDRQGAVEQQCRGRGDSEREGDRHVDQQQDEEGEEQDD